MRKKSAVGEAQRRELLESARRLSPDQRLEACVQLSRSVAELHREGRAARRRPPPEASASS